MSYMHRKVDRNSATNKCPGFVVKMRNRLTQDGYAIFFLLFILGLPRDGKMVFDNKNIILLSQFLFVSLIT